jgi:hypothetical protein
MLDVGNIVVMVIVLVISVYLYRRSLKKNPKAGGKEGKDSFGVLRPNEIVFYHAGWCGYCKEFLPVFDRTIPVLKTRFPGLIVTKYMDETDHVAIMRATPPIEGFPTIRMNGAEFQGPRTQEGLIMFVVKNWKR